MPEGVVLINSDYYIILFYMCSIIIQACVRARTYSIAESKKPLKRTTGAGNLLSYSLQWLFAFRFIFSAI